MKKAKIDGKFPTIDLKNVKLDDFLLLSRKNSAYIPRIKLNSVV